MASKKVVLKKFDDFPVYSDPGSINQLCRDILPKQESADKKISIGVCHVQGPGQVAESSHAEWTQYFVVISGKGTLYYNGSPHPLAEKTIVCIPRNTKHYVACAKGEQIEYLYINQYLKNA